MAMMTYRLRILLLIVGVIAFFIIVHSLRKKKIDFRFGLVWIFIVFFVVFFAAFPRLLDLISSAFGIASPVNMLFFFGCCFFIVVIFYQSIVMSKQSIQIQKLAQEVAILRYDALSESEVNKNEV